MPQRTLAASLLLPLVIAACEVSSGEPARVDVPPAEERTGIPLRLVGPNDAAVLVPVVLNGDSLDLVLDTGATLTCLDRSVAERLELEPVRGATGLGVGAQGTGRMELVQIDSLTVGDATAYDLMGCVLDLEQLRLLDTDVDGLLGLNALKPFRVVVDFPGRELRLEGGEP